MIVTRTQNLIVVDKPAAWLTTPARHPADPRPCLGHKLTELLGQQIYPVHRLDFGVSGLVIFALNAEAHRVAQRWFEHAQIKKLYEARSQTEPGLEILPEHRWTEWRSVVVRGKRRTFEGPHGKEAITLARRRDDGAYELRPVTGRPHQLRFEMAKRGFAIDGDVLYGGRPLVDGEMRLRAVELDFSAVTERLGLPELIRIESLDHSATGAPADHSL